MSSPRLGTKNENGKGSNTPKRIVPDRKTNGYPAEQKSVTGLPPLMPETDSIRLLEKGASENENESEPAPPAAD
jgi:hypothetical protein